jgi:hypothetical protein
MARTAFILRASATVALAATLAACAATPAATQVAVATSVAPPTASPALTASPSPPPTASPSPETVAPPESPTPKLSAKPLPSFDQAELDAFMTASITLLDLADADLSVAIAYVDPGGSKPFDLGTYSLKFTEQLTNQVPPGTYRLTFRQPAAGKTASSCTIDVADGEAFTFAAIDGAVAITKAGTTPKKSGDLFVATSSLCAR